MTTGAGEGGSASSDFFPFDDNIIDDNILSGLISEEEMTVGSNKKPRTYFIPSREFGITAKEAADILRVRNEIKHNQELLKAAIIILMAEKRSIEEIV